MRRDLQPFLSYFAIYTTKLQVMNALPPHGQNNVTYFKTSLIHNFARSVIFPYQSDGNESGYCSHIIHLFNTH